MALGLAAAGGVRGQQPGGVLPGALPSFQTDGVVYEAAAGPGDTVMLAGDFWSVNGTPAPGLAQLAATGALRESFRPAVGVGDSVMSPWFGGVEKSPGLLPLGDGRLLLAAYSWDAAAWTVLDAGGAERAGDFPSLLRGGAGRTEPQFVQGDWLYVLQRPPSLQGPALVRASVATGAEDAAFAVRSVENQAGTSFQITRAWPADGGRFWAGGVPLFDPSLVDTFRTGTRIVVARHAPDGARDASFLPQEYYQEGYWGGTRFLPASDGSLLRVIPQNWGWNYTPSPTTMSIEIGLVTDDPGAPSAIQHTRPLLAPFTSGRMADGGLVANLSAPFDTLRKYRADGTTDESFQPVPVASHVLGLPDGGVLAGGVRRYTVTGTAAAGWQVPVLRRPAVVRQVAGGPGGSLFLLGDISECGGSACGQVVKVQASGALEAGFRYLPEAGYVPGKIAPLPDGRVFVLEQPESGWTRDPFYRRARVVRLRADGSRDAAFPPWDGVIHLDGVSLDGGNIIDLRARPDGFVLVQMLSGSDVWQSYWQLIGPDGGRIASGPGNAPREYRQTREALVLRDGRFWVGTTRFTAAGVPDGTTAALADGSEPLAELSDGRTVFQYEGRLSAVSTAGTVDADYGGSRQFLLYGTSVAPGENGKLYLTLPNYGTGPVEILRLHRHGRVDPTFRAPVLEKQTVAPGLVTRVLTPDGIRPVEQTVRIPYQIALHYDGSRLWVGGDFTLPRPTLTALATGTAAGYDAWSAACFARSGSGSTARAADPDGDGLTNLAEYAGGTDPLAPDGGGLRVVSQAPLRFSAPRNPEAPEISASIEVSEDALTWRRATAAEVALQGDGLALTFEALPGPPRRFFRIRYSEGGP